MKSKLQKCSVFVLLLLIGSIVVPAQNGQLQGFDEYVAKAVNDWEVPGLAIAVVKDDKIVFAKGYGVRELGKSAPVTDRTLFAIGSTTKAFTAAALAMLVDEGKLKWDDSPTKYLAGFRLYDPYVTREMTVRDLLTHRLGLDRGDLLWYASPYDRNEVLNRVRYLKPASSMRSRYGYQNIMFLAAGQIVPSITGREWDDFVRDRIFVPLGMNATGTTIRTLANSNDVATPHGRLDDKWQPVAWRNIDNIAPAGSINSNVYEMAQWVRLQLGGGVYEGKRLVSAAAMKEMHSPQTIQRIAGATERLFPEIHFSAYGLGWGMNDYRGRKVLTHSGGIDGMSALVAMIPEEKIGLVILTNMGSASPNNALAYKIFDTYLGGRDRDWSVELLKDLKTQQEQARATAAKTEADRVKGTSATLSLDKYAGDYENEMYGPAKIVHENGKLMAQIGSNFVGELEHWNYDTFRVTWRDRMLGREFITFRINRQGKVEGLNRENVADFARTP